MALSISKETALRAGFLIAFASAVGSLIFSEILKFPPCTLCWYQRICMYPLIVIYGVALWSDDRGFHKYSLPLVAIGLALAAYHNLLYYGVVETSIVPCQQGVSCTSKQIEYFGFVTIPFLSMMSFVVLAAAEILSLRRRST